MTLALISGVLAEPLIEKQAKTGRTFWVTKLKAKEGEGFVYWKLIVFSESAAAELEQLAIGDGLSVSGRLDLSVWNPGDREPRINYGLTVEGVLLLKPKKREKARDAAPQLTHVGKSPPPPPPPEQHPLDRYSRGHGHDEFNDALPF